MTSYDGVHVDAGAADIVSVLSKKSESKYVARLVIPLCEDVAVLGRDHAACGLRQPAMLHKILDVWVAGTELPDPSVERERRVDAAVRVWDETVDIRPASLREF